MVSSIDPIQISNCNKSPNFLTEIPLITKIFLREVAVENKVKIFVSYAQADLKPYPRFNTSRVGQIIAEIKYNLRCHDRRSRFEILRDCEGMINVGDNIDENVEAAIDECDIAVILLSESYCLSEDECVREFVSIIKKKKPVFIAETDDSWDKLYNLTRNEIDGGADRILRAVFWGVENGGVKHYGHPLPDLVPENEKQKYYEVIEQITSGIQVKSDEIVSSRNPAVATVELLGDSQTILIAALSADVRKEGNRLANALIDADHKVVTFESKRHFRDGNDPKLVLDQMINNCGLVIQLIGGYVGAKLGETEQRVVPLLHKCATSSETPFLAWQLPDFDPEECHDEHIEFLKSADAHHSPIEEFERYLLNTAKKIMREHASNWRREQKLKDTPKDTDFWPIVIIDSDEQDLQVANVLFDALEGHSEVSNLPIEIDRKTLEQEAEDSDGIVLVYSNSREGQNRISNHFRFIRRAQRLNPNFAADVAIGNGLKSEQDGSAIPYPRGKNVKIINVDPENSEVDLASLGEFIEKAKEKAQLRCSV